MALTARSHAHPATTARGLFQSLDAARLAVEGRFLEAGEVLGQAVEDLGGLIGSLDKLALALDDGVVGATTAELQSAAASLLALPARHAHRRELLQRLADAGARLAAEIDDMSRQLAYLRVFAISIKVTAAGIPAANQEFGAFAQEICDCIQQGRTQLQAFDADIQALRAAFAQALIQEQALSGQCGDVLAAVPEGLVKTTAELTAHHRRIGEAAAQVSVLARDIRKKVGAALGALQIGDITRQRVEHVTEALTALNEVRGLSADQGERLEAYVHGLLAAQLRSTAEDFHRDVARIGSAMGGIAGDAGQILQLRDRAFGRADGADPGFLRRLEGHVGQALELVADMAGADADAQRMGDRASLAAAGLGERIGHLRAMEGDVQHMALNTTLKCSRIGDDGRPLAVIAVELRAHAGHVETSTRQALTALDSLSGDAARLGSAADAGATGDIGAVLAESTARLRVAGDAVEADLGRFSQQGEAVVEALRRACGRLDFEREIGSILDRAADGLAERAGPAAPRTEDLAEPLGGLLALLSRGYTMAQEREVHRRHTADLAFAVSAPAAAKAVAELDDVLF
jgi:hypothetical protein